MCGIVGYIGNAPVVTTLLESLKRLEYRGYDSAGIAVLNGHGIEVCKRVGKLHVLAAAVASTALKGRAGVGHTRWATHGEPSETNAHPHVDCQGSLAIVHNGIIENYAELKHYLATHGHRFRSQTDTEVIAHLIEEHARRLPLPDAFRRALTELEGTYAVCLLAVDDPHRLYGARCGSPLIVGLGREEALLASDVPAVLSRAKQVVYLNDREVVELGRTAIRIMTLEGQEVRRDPSPVAWDPGAVRKDGFEHFMLKEIHEQPKAIERTLAGRLDAARGQVIVDQDARALLGTLQPTERFILVACGTAYHAALAGEYMLEEFARIPVDVDLASEFRYRNAPLDPHTTVVAISQSGETADTLAAVRLARTQGARVLSICNVPGSSLVRESDAVLYTQAGPEIAVASTKAYTSQLTVLTVLTLHLARSRGLLEGARWDGLVKTLAGLPGLAARALGTEPAVARVAEAYAAVRNIYYLGRRYHVPSAFEGALKLKEVCPLIHAEGYAAGEMKHGPISLIRQGWPVVFLATDSAVYEKVVSNIEEVRARKGSCLVIATEGNRTIARYADALLQVPRTEELFAPVLAAIPLQLLAYHIAKLNGCDVDQPPNLAKSVTVE